MPDSFAEWIGREVSAEDVLEPARSNALSAATGRRETGSTGEPLPALHHWLYFWDVRPAAGLGADGHPAIGGFLPPIRRPRRMWAGGRLTFERPLSLGERVRKTSKILSINEKTGRSGPLVFVTVEHRLSGESGLAIIEEQDLVYRDATAPGSVALPADASPAPDAEWCETVDPDPVLLFRYSALTMNGHRIHYDRPYAINEEAYPALVVHGPLQATLMMDLAARKLSGAINTFTFRGQAPAFDGRPLHVCGEATERGADLWTQQARTKNMIANVSCSEIT